MPDQIVQHREKPVDKNYDSQEGIRKIKRIQNHNTYFLKVLKKYSQQQRFHDGLEHYGHLVRDSSKCIRLNRQQNY